MARSKNVSVKDLIKADLARSGVTNPATLRRLDISPLEQEDLVELADIHHAVAYKIPYFSLQGTPTKFCRYRIIYLKNSTKKRIKYFQLPRTIPQAYFPPLARVDWKKIASDPGQKIVITEGEKKAVKSTTDLYPTVGLGGVWAWKSKKRSINLLPSLREINWNGRRVEICYDNDVYENELVNSGSRALAFNLSQLGAHVVFRVLPQDEGKIGLDDYLLDHSPEDYEQLPVEVYETSRELLALNDDLVYVRRQRTYFSSKTKIFYPNINELRKEYTQTATREDGKEVNVASIWVNWKLRRSCLNTVYEPDQPTLVNDNVNLWRAWGTTPRRGNTAPFMELICAMFPNKRDRDWVLRWLAYPIQHAGTKLFTSLVIWSHDQGTGKTFLAKIISDIYGENATTITQNTLHNDRNDWLVQRQFVVGNEVSTTEKRQDAERLKHLITEEEIIVNPKYQHPFTLANVANFLFTSNNSDAIKIDLKDRRFAVMEIRHNLPDSFWKKLDKWRKNGGSAAVHDYLLNKVSVKNFDPNQRAPTTEAKDEMVRAAMSDIERWAMDFMADPDGAFGTDAPAISRDVFTSSELMMYLPDRMRRVGVSTMSRMLRKYGAVGFPGTVRVGHGVKRLMAVRNLDFWIKHREDQNMWAQNYASNVVMLDNRRKKSRKRKIKKKGRRKK